LPSRPTLNAVHVIPELHDRLFAEFAQWGRGTAVLWVLDGNERALSFYRRNGWVHDASRTSHEVGAVAVPALRYGRAVTSSATRR
jgi:hypothetical protein